MKNKKFFLLFFVVFFFPFIAHAQSVSGSTYWYVQQGTTMGMPSGYLPSHSVATSFPNSNYDFISAIDTNNQIYYAIKQVYLNPTNYSFTHGNSYKITVVFDKGSYLIGSSSLLGYTNNRNLTYCGASGNANDLTTCSIQWTDNSSTRWTAVIYYTPTVTANSAYFQIGNVNTSGNVFLFNNYSSGDQGLKITSFDVEVDNSGTSAIINNQNQNTTNIINNNNQNTQSIINNQNNNTQSIINNQNQNTQQQIESQKVCKTTHIDKNDGVIDGYLNVQGSVVSGTSVASLYTTTDFISYTNNTEVVLLNVAPTDSRYICFYNSSKTVISCANSNTFTVNEAIAVPTNTSYIRFTIYKAENIPTYDIKSCKNGNQAINDSVDDLNNNLTDDDTSGATAQADSEISNFDIDDHGLGDIFNTIVTFIGNIANQTCSPLSFQLPFVHNQVTLPCMSTIYNANFPTFLALYQMITTGLIAYRVIINLFQKVKQLSDPNYDKVEVIQL